MIWNYNLEEAPKGLEETVVYERKGKKQTRVTRKDELLLLSTKCGSVIKSFWNTKRKSWSGLATGEEPVAWMPWPEPAKVLDGAS